MKTLERKKDMVAKTLYKSGAEIPPAWQKEFDVKPDRYLKITIEDITEREYDTVNVGDEIVEGLKEIIAHKKGEMTFPPAL